MTTPKQSFGIKIAQPGYSTDNAPDYALAFNSSWPSLPVVKEFDVTLQPTFDGSFWSFASQTFTHNLGFWALADVWETNSPNSQTGLTQPANLTYRNNSALYLGLNECIWSSPYGFLSSQPQPMTVHVTVYNIDISKPVAYDYVQPPVVQAPYDPNFGMKIAKANKSIDSKDLRDFVVHTRAQSPAILSIITEASKDSSNAITYANPQGYTNWVSGYYRNFFGFISLSKQYYGYVQAQSQAFPNYQFLNGTTYSLFLGSSSTFPGNTAIGSLVVLRDPLFVPTVLDVTY